MMRLLRFVKPGARASCYREAWRVGVVPLHVPRGKEGLSEGDGDERGEDDALAVGHLAAQRRGQPKKASSGEAMRGGEGGGPSGRCSSRANTLTRLGMVASSIRGIDRRGRSRQIGGPTAYARRWARVESQQRLACLGASRQ
jgi:hypothetical protein